MKIEYRGEARDYERIANDTFWKLPSFIKIQLEVLAWFLRMNNKLHTWIHCRNHGKEARKAEQEIARLDMVHGPLWRHPTAPYAIRLRNRGLV